MVRRLQWVQAVTKEKPLAARARKALSLIIFISFSEEKNKYMEKRLL